MLIMTMKCIPRGCINIYALAFIEFVSQISQEWSSCIFYFRFRKSLLASLQIAKWLKSLNVLLVIALSNAYKSKMAFHIRLIYFCLRSCRSDVCCVGVATGGNEWGSEWNAIEMPYFLISRTPSTRVFARRENIHQTHRTSNVIEAI